MTTKKLRIRRSWMITLTRSDCLVTSLSWPRFKSEMARAAVPGSSTSSLSPEDMTARNYLMLLYGLFERTHLLYRKKWIDQETWNQWSTFLEVVAKHPLFKDVHRTGEG